MTFPARTRSAGGLRAARRTLLFLAAATAILLLPALGAAAANAAPQDGERAPAGTTETSADEPGASEPDAEAPPEATPETAPSARFEQRLEVTALAPEVVAGDELPGRSLESGASPDAVAHLRGEPGLAAARRGVVNLDPQVRGLSETQVATLVDGTRTFAAGPARMDSGLAHVGPHAVESVRVVKGPYALTWGSGALAAIRLDTYRPPFTAGGFSSQGRAGLRYGDNGEVSDLFANLAGSGERLRFSLLAGRRQGSDYTAGDGTTVPGDFTSSEARLHLGAQAAPGLLLGLEGGYQDQHDLDYAGRLLDATYFHTRSYAGRLDWAPVAPAVDEVSLLVYSNRKDHRMNNDEKPTALPAPGRVPPFALDVDLPTESNITGGRASVAGRSGELTWSLGGDTYRLRQNARRTISRRDDGRVLFRDTVWPDAQLDDTGLWAQVVRRADTLGRGGATLAATLRYDHWSADAGTVSPFFAATAGTPAPRDDDLFSAALSGRLALGDAWTVNAGIGRAVRTPTALELYSDRFPSSRFQVAAEFLGDPGLDPETAWQLDLGTDYAAGGVHLSLSAFYRRLDDNVTVLADPTLPRRLPLSPPRVYRYVNGTRATYVGAEASLDARLGDAWTLRAAAAWLRGDDRELDEPAFGVAPPWVSLGARWNATGSARGPWVDLGARWVERQDRVATGRLEQATPGHTVVDLAAGWRFGDRWELAAGADNLLDEAYADHLSSLNPFTGERIAEPGRSLYARLEVDF